jgi:uncharacterized protein (TIGR03435 family)
MRRTLVVLCALLVLGGARANGQSATTDAPRFEVASVKPGTSPADFGRAMAAGGGRVSFPFFGVRTQPGGRLQALSNLQGLILTAYGIKSYQIEGGPKWMTTDYFDISAKAERETATDAELFQMLRSLLAERFGLRVHIETRQLPVYTLTVARPDGRLGSGLKPASEECVKSVEERKRTGAPFSPPPGPRAPLTPVCGMMTMSMNRNGSATLAAGGQPFSAVVNQVSGELAAHVVDQTGLTGLFDIVLEYESNRRFAGGPPPGLDPNSTDSPPLPLPAALQQQLGLKLEKGIGPLPITIVDAAEPPSAN